MKMLILEIQLFDFEIILKSKVFCTTRSHKQLHNLLFEKFDKQHKVRTTLKASITII